MKNESNLSRREILRNGIIKIAIKQERAAIKQIRIAKLFNNLIILCINFSCLSKKTVIYLKK